MDNTQLLVRTVLDRLAALLDLIESALAEAGETQEAEDGSGSW